jgi:hypothetical protein
MSTFFYALVLYLLVTDKVDGIVLEFGFKLRSIPNNKLSKNNSYRTVSKEKKLSIKLLNKTDNMFQIYTLDEFNSKSLLATLKPFKLTHNLKITNKTGLLIHNPITHKQNTFNVMDSCTLIIEKNL